MEQNAHGSGVLQGIRQCTNLAVKEVMIYTAIEELFDKVLVKIKYGDYKR